MHIWFYRCQNDAIVSARAVSEIAQERSVLRSPCQAKSRHEQNQEQRAGIQSVKEFFRQKQAATLSGITASLAVNPLTDDRGALEFLPLRGQRRRQRPCDPELPEQGLRQFVTPPCAETEIGKYGLEYVPFSKRGE